MQTVAGVDCHRDIHSILFLNEVGRTVRELTIPVSSEGYEQALAIASELGVVRWGVEVPTATGVSLRRRSWRVSSKEQGAGGLGIEAHRAAVAGYAAAQASPIVAHYEKVETA